MEEGTDVERPMRERPFCAAVSRESGESLDATASRIDHWLLVEYRAAWRRDVLDGSLLSARLKEHLRAQLDALRPSRLLFVKQPERRAANGRQVFFARSRPGEEQLVGLELEHHDDLCELDLTGSSLPGMQVMHPLLAVCTHGKRDRCCAREGLPLYDALRAAATPAEVWQSTHVGGDRFAGNVVVLPHGLFYGRVVPGDVEGLLAAHTAGRIDGDRYRGRSTFPFPVQAAEQALRAAERLAGIDDITLLGYERRGEEAWSVRLAVRDGAVHSLDVVSELGEPERLTCGAAEPRRPRRYRVTRQRAG